MSRLATVSHRIVFFILLGIASGTVCAGPYDRAIANGAQYLAAAQSPIDGSWQSQGSQARFLETSAAVAALDAVNQRGHAYYSGVTWLANHAATNLDFVSRRALALSQHYVNTTPDVFSIAESNKSNPGANGGYGLSSIYEGSPLDTALALQALSASGVTEAGVQSGLAYLKLAQRSAVPRGWSTTWHTLDPNGSFDAVVTAQVLIALKYYAASDSSLLPLISSGLDALKSQVNTGSPLRVRALTTLAYLKAGAVSDIYTKDMLNSLLSAQAADGYWGYDVYDTALVLQVLAVAAQRDLAADRTVVDIPDVQLRYVINQQLGRNAMDQLNVGEMKLLTSLNASDRGIEDLNGLQYAVNLSFADFSKNNIKDTSVVAGLAGYPVFNLTGNPVNSGNRLMANVGQTVVTGKNLFNGVPLRINVRDMSRANFIYLPSSLDLAAPSLSIRGFMQWMNMYSVRLIDPVYQNSLIVERLQDPLFSYNSETLIGSVVNRLSVSVYPGAVFEFDTNTGKIISIGGYQHATLSADFSTNKIAGGYCRPQNIKYIFESKNAIGDLIGARNALGELSERPVASASQVPLWTYESITGPASIPLAALASATSASNLSTILQNAGFTVLTSTASEIVFRGNYAFNGLTASEDLKDFACFAFGCSKVAENSLSAPGADYLGKFTAQVVFGIPLVP